MAGLLDINNPEVLQGLMMLGARQGQMPGLLSGILQMQEQRKRQAMQEQAQKQAMEMQGMQMDQMRRQQAQQEQIQSLAPQFMRPGAAPSLTPSDDEGNPMPSTRPSFDMQGYSQAMMGIDPMRGIGLQAQLAQLNQRENPMRVGRDDRLIDPRTGRVVVDAAPEKPKTPEIGKIREIMSGGKTLQYEWTGQKWEKVGEGPRFKPDAPEKPEKPPQGYRYAGGGSSLEPIPGGPADAKVGEKAEALEKREKNAIARADFVISSADKAINFAKSKALTTGIAGGMMQNIRGSDAYRLNKLIDPIRANIGFSELQAMREASPTGGALGQVAVQELNMLQSVLGSLDTAQSEGDVVAALSGIKKHFEGWKNAVQQSRTGASGASGGWSVREIK